MTAATWNHKDVWHMRGKNFLIEVKRYAVEPSPYPFDGGINRWAVYAYIYPTHPYFSHFDGGNMWQDAATAMPLHCGPSFLRWHYDDNKRPLSVQVGADYNHLHDARFATMETQGDAPQVFADAEKLHAWLTAKDTGEQP